MPKKGFRTITIHEDVANKLIKLAKEHKKVDVKMGITEFVALLLDLHDKALEHGIRFQPLVYHKDHVLIMDFKLRKPIKVYYRKGKVECAIHRSDDCSHAGFAYSLEKVRGIITNF